MDFRCKSSVVDVDSYRIGIGVRGVVGAGDGGVHREGLGGAVAIAGHTVAADRRGSGVATDGSAEASRGTQLISHLVNVAARTFHQARTSGPAVGWRQAYVVRCAVRAGHVDGVAAGDVGGRGRHAPEVEIGTGGNFAALDDGGRGSEGKGSCRCCSAAGRHTVPARLQRDTGLAAGESILVAAGRWRCLSREQIPIHGSASGDVAITWYGRCDFEWSVRAALGDGTPGIGGRVARILVELELE